MEEEVNKRMQIRANTMFTLEIKHPALSFPIPISSRFQPLWPPLLAGLWIFPIIKRR